MTRRIAIIAAAMLALTAGMALAHEGHTHTVMGTVATYHENHLEVKTTDGKSVTITLNEKTTVLRGMKKLTLGDLAVGQRVVVDVGDGKVPLVAREVKLGAPPQTPAAKAKS